MSITSAMYTGVTGLLSYSSSMSVVSNNLANVNTVGFKTSRVQFADLLSAKEGGDLIGRGVRLASVSPLFSQGVYQATGSVSDLTVQGKGLFIVKNTDGQSFYTRAGQFSLNQNGKLVTPEGHTVQGFPVNQAKQTIGGLEDIVLGGGLSLLPEATTKITLAVNLDSRVTTPTAAWPGGAGTEDTVANWYAAKNYAATVRVYDSLGQEHQLSFLFRKSATNPLQWEYRVLAPVEDVQAPPANPGNLIAVSEGVVAFNTDGTLDAAGSTINDISIQNLVNGAADLLVSAANLSFKGSTQVATASTLSSFQADGSAPGTLTGFAIDPQGIITGQYSNGGLLPLYQIALADFPGVERLTPAGGTLFARSPESGDAIIGTPGGGGFGSVLSGGLEQSTVDVAQEFVSMIGAQRGFQANSRVITVADQMYDEVVNLKR
ncbi:MAG TPA: flagellar hook protein FlgE [Methylomirabilota bacterium]|jgi:flagellar hook protein FlgE|nr:flagellar hook protein FlgE [Methylomirabilota bacterium]